MWNQDLSLGIDISDRHVSAVLLSRRRDKIYVVKAVSQSLPSSAFSADSAKTVQTAGRIIRQMLLRAGIRQKDAWISFGSEGLLLQMVDMPEQLPANLGQYIRKQIRNSTLLNSKNPCVDFTAVTKSDSGDTQKCLVAAIDSARIETLLKSLSLASVNPKVIDIPTIALYRALYKRELSGAFKQHTLLFYLHGRDIYLTVLRKTNLDYVRHLERIAADSSQDFTQWSVEQIRAVVQFYETEFIAKGDEEITWQYVLVSEGSSDETGQLKNGIETSVGQNILCLNPQNAAAGMPIEKNEKIDYLPLAATGAALRKWYSSPGKTQIDLLPEQNRKKRFVVDYFINTSKIAAAVLMLILFCTYVLSDQVSKTQNKAGQNGPAASSESIEQWVTEKKNLFEQLATIKKQKEQVEAMIGGYTIGSMVDLMDQIRRHTPAGVRITQLWSSGKGLVEIQGYCATMEDVQNYARLLETADSIKAAQVRQSEMFSRNGKLRSFTIICTLREGI